MDHRSKCKTQIYRNFRKIHRKKSSGLIAGKKILDMTPKAQSFKKLIIQTSHQNLKHLLHERLHRGC